jgi:hypothetical protein
MRAPGKSRLNDVVSEIVVALNEAADDRLAGEVDVRGVINFLRESDREVSYRGGIKSRTSIRGKRQENADDFAAGKKQIGALQKALQKISSPALVLLFSNETDVHSDSFPAAEAQQKTLRRLQHFTAMLAYLQRRCEFLLDERPGEHGSADYRQRRVAWEAWRLLRRHWKEPAGGTMDSLYGQIASLLYEAMTGEANKDLQWACKAALRAADRGELRDGGLVIGRDNIPLS